VVAETCPVFLAPLGKRLEGVLHGVRDAAALVLHFETRAPERRRCPKDPTRMRRARYCSSMAKSSGATRKSQTHFEQVPIEIVKKIADQGVPKDNKAETVRGPTPVSRKKR